MDIRLAKESDIDGVEAIYDEIHAQEECGATVIGWARNVYPTRATAQASLARGDLFVLEDEGMIAGAAIINKTQVDAYAQGAWKHPAADEQVMVLHTLVVSPNAARRGYGRAFVDFYEAYAKVQGCTALRMDTNARNTRARAMYAKLGYDEIGIVPCVFNGIEGVRLVLLEKKI